MAMVIRDERALRRVAAVLLLFAALQILSMRYHDLIWVNLTDSEPLGLYRLHPLQGEVQRGEMIVMEVPAEFQRYVYSRGWLPDGWPLLKHIGAVAGDFYCVGNGRFIINGRVMGPVYLSDHDGLPLPRVEGCREVPFGHFLPVATRISRSFDGRYMGAVRLSLIKGVARPILTF